VLFRSPSPRVWVKIDPSISGDPTNWKLVVLRAVRNPFVAASGGDVISQFYTRDGGIVAGTQHGPFGVTTNQQYENFFDCGGDANHIIISTAISGVHRVFLFDANKLFDPNQIGQSRIASTAATYASSHIGAGGGNGSYYVSGIGLSGTHPVGGGAMPNGGVWILDDNLVSTTGIVAAGQVLGSQSLWSVDGDDKVFWLLDYDQGRLRRVDIVNGVADFDPGRYSLHLVSQLASPDLWGVALSVYGDANRFAVMYGVPSGVGPQEGLGIVEFRDTSVPYQFSFNPFVETRRAAVPDPVFPDHTDVDLTGIGGSGFELDVD